MCEDPVQGEPPTLKSVEHVRGEEEGGVRRDSVREGQEGDRGSLGDDRW